MILWKINPFDTLYGNYLQLTDATAHCYVTIENKIFPDFSFFRVPLSIQENTFVNYSFGEYGLDITQCEKEVSV